MTSRRENNYNLIRLLLAGCVIVSHSYELIDGSRVREPLGRLGSVLSLGDFAVSGFFVLSGYLICVSWLRSPTPLKYWRNRIFRIVPGFLFCLLATIGFYTLVFDSAFISRFDWSSFVPKLMLLQAGGTPEAYPNTHYPVLNQSLWTIHYEFLCYIGLFILAMTRVLRKRLAIAMLLVLLVADCGWRAGAFSVFGMSVVDESNSLVRYYLLNCLRFSVCYLAGIVWAFNQRFVTDKSLFLGMFAGVLLPFAIQAPVLAYSALAVLLVPILAMLGERMPMIRGPWLHHDVSYGVYLYGWPIQKTLLASMAIMCLPSALIGASLVLALVAGWLSWSLIEKPCLKFSKGLAMDRAVPVA